MVLYTLISKIILKCKSKITYLAKKVTWRKRNKHNFTKYKNIRFLDLVEVGNYTYGDIDIQMSRPLVKVKIGNYCGIGKGVFFIPYSDHPTNYISTYPFKTMFGKHNEDATTKGDIIVEDDVWIGYNATILSGVHIGQGAIIAAGAVVCNDIPAYAIAGGVPAKVIKYRFEKEKIDELLKIDFSKLSREMVNQYEKELYKPLDDINQLSWLPRK